MDNFYGDNNGEWLELTEPVFKQESIDDDRSSVTAPEKSENKRNFRAPVLSIQVFVSITAILCLLLLKFVFFDAYSFVKDVYTKELNASLVTDLDFSDLDYSLIFSTPDEI